MEDYITKYIARDIVLHFHSKPRNDLKYFETLIIYHKSVLFVSLKMKKKRKEK